MQTSEIDQVDHCELRPSRAESWVRCPGSISLTRGLILPPEHPSAAYGVRAHQIAAQMLNAEPTDAPDDDAMRRIVEEYVAWCDHIRRFASRTWIEFKVSLDAMNPPAPMFGTLDFMAYSVFDGVGHLDICDLKTGVVPVHALGNYQLQYYALAALACIEKELSVPVTRVQLAIVQPRLHRVSMDETTPERLKQFSVQLLAAAADAMSDDPPFTPGEIQCRVCPARHVCVIKYRPPSRRHRRATDDPYGFE